MKSVFLYIRFADKKLKLLMSSSDLYNSLVPKVILFPKCSKDEIPIFVCEINIVDKKLKLLLVNEHVEIFSLDLYNSLVS